MERVGDGGISTNVDIANSVISEFKDGGNSDGDVPTDIAMIHNQVGTGEVSAVDPLMSDKIASNDVGNSLVLEEKKKKPKKKRRNNGAKKPPDAPKRFKSSFIFFSMAKHKEIKEIFARGVNTKVTNITSMVSEAWRTLEPLEKQKFEEMARQDKVRYDIEKRNYVPPPGMSLTSKRKRDPDAPKRPMSAYLSYANKLRGKVKSENPDCSNGEISKILSNMWKGISDDERKGYKENEQLLWGIYREKMVEWKNNNDGRKKGGTKMVADLLSQKSSKKSKKSKDNANLRSIDFSRDAVVDNNGGVDEQLLGLGGVPGMDTNPNTDEMMAASALRGVRGGPQQHLGVGTGDTSHINGYGGFFGVNGTNGMHPMLSGTPAAGQAGFGQIEMSGFPYNQYGYPLGGNPHAMIMAQLRGTPHQQYPGFMPIDQQANLSQLASLAGVQNDVTQQQQQLHQPIDQSVPETGMNMEMGNGNMGSMGNSELNDNSEGSSNTSF